jgi:hypothetical protein
MSAELEALKENIARMQDTINRLRSPTVEGEKVLWPDASYRELQAAYHRMRTKYEISAHRLERVTKRNGVLVRTLERLCVTMSSSNPKTWRESFAEMYDVLLEEEWLKNHAFEYHYQADTDGTITEYCKICDLEKSKHLTDELPIPKPPEKPGSRTEKGITDMAAQMLRRILKRT